MAFNSRFLLACNDACTKTGVGDYHNFRHAGPGRPRVHKPTSKLILSSGYKRNFGFVPAENSSVSTSTSLFLPHARADEPSRFSEKVHLKAGISTGQLDMTSDNSRSPSLVSPLLPFHLTLIAFCQLAAPQWSAVNEAFAEQLQPPATLRSEPSIQPSAMQNLLSAFDSSEVLPSGKKLPKEYLATAREVVRTLRESLSTDYGSDSGFRKSADAAKTAIRSYIGRWRNSPLVSGEESYRAIEVALRELGAFYSKSGPSAAMPNDVKERVMFSLNQAEVDL